MSVDEVAGAIRRMEIRGAGRIARNGVEAIMDLVAEHQGDDLEALLLEIDTAREKILASRPTAVSLWNGVQAALRGVAGASSVEEAKELVSRNSERFIERSNKALEVIGRIGARRIRGGDTVLTHCNSQAALSVILTAYREGKAVEVIATESRPWRQGLLTVRQLADAGVPVTMIVDSAVRAVMRDVDVVVVGADTITSSGTVINKIGTSQIALAAHEARVPFLVCSETYKFSPMTLGGEMVEIEERGRGEVVDEGEVPDSVKVRNPVFDATPPEYVDSIITEIGMIPPFAAYEVIVKELGQESIFES
jgi:ribose 1,5-bisphosphate isomerase